MSLSRSGWAQQTEEARESSEAIAVRVDGPPGCPSGEDFWRSVEQRVPGLRLTRPNEPGRVLLVRFELDERGNAKGRLRILDVDGSALEREVDGSGCTEVAEALALIAAVSARGARSIDAAPADFPAAERLEGMHPLRTRSPTFTGDVAAASPRANLALGWMVLLRADGSLRTQIVPTAFYGAGVGVELVRRGPSLWEPAVGALVEATLTATASTADIAPNTAMSGDLMAAHLFASPLRLRAGPIDARPYFAVDAGRLTMRGQGNGLQREEVVRRFWIAAAILARADVRLGSGFALGAKIGAEVHPLLFQFEYTPRTVYQVGGLGVVTGFSASFRFE